MSFGDGSKKLRYNQFVVVFVVQNSKYWQNGIAKLWISHYF